MVTIQIQDLKLPKKELTKDEMEKVTGGFGFNFYRIQSSKKCISHTIT